jgi:hypothetical protein
VDVGAEAHIATHPRMLYTLPVEYPFPPVGIVGAADGKNRRAFLFSNGLVRVMLELLLCSISVSSAPLWLRNRSKKQPQRDGGT